MTVVPASTGIREKILHPDASALDLATIMRTVGDPVRLEIVRLLADGQERSCGDLSTALGMPASTAPITCASCARRGHAHARRRHAAPDLAPQRGSRRPVPRARRRAVALSYGSGTPRLRVITFWSFCSAAFVPGIVHVGRR